MFGRVPELYQGAEASLSSRPGLGARRPGGIGRLRTSIHPGHRRRWRRRVAGDAPPRLLLRDSPWDPCGDHGVSHHYPFAFSLPVDFYDVGLHSVIVGDEDSDVAHVPFIVQMVTLDEH